VPELPEVEVLVRHLGPLLRNKIISSVQVRRERVLRPTTAPALSRALRGARFGAVERRGKYLLFIIQPRGVAKPRLLVGHLGMTGRMYLTPRTDPLPKHAAVILGLGEQQFVFEDTRYFGRLTLDTSAIEALGPEPLSDEFTVKTLAAGLNRSAQPIKVKLLDQSLVAGLGNIYASEALFRARVSPRMPARRLTDASVRRLWRAIRETLSTAIQFGSTVPLNYSGTRSESALFYYGVASENAGPYEERLRVYDRKGQACIRCGGKIRRIVQAARSTFYCPSCQRSAA
jgi:formamidopyrimidine-DNA glycosylase